MTDAVEPTDALLEQTRIVGQIEEDEMMGELKVAAFAADLGADQEPGATFLSGFGEPSPDATSQTRNPAGIERTPSCASVSGETAF